MSVRLGTIGALAAAATTATENLHGTTRECGYGPFRVGPATAMFSTGDGASRLKMAARGSNDTVAAAGGIWPSGDAEPTRGEPARVGWLCASRGNLELAS
jgi:hypothetical protein